MSFSLILTHPGGSHKDEFLACCLLIAQYEAPVVRREPTIEDLENPQIAVVDVGGEHDPARGNFDHHQFPKDHPPLCALSLVLQYLGVYEDAREFCDWLETAEWLDTRGPVETMRKMGAERELLSKLNSPIDITLLRRFSMLSEVECSSTLWEVMHWIGSDLLAYIKGQRQRFDFIERVGEFWKIDSPNGGPFHVFYLPRTEPLQEEPSAGVGRFVEKYSNGKNVVGLIYPDRRGSGFGLSRHKDNLQLDFTRIQECEDVHFAHVRGFVAKTSATKPERLRDLMRQSWKLC